MNFTPTNFKVKSNWKIGVVTSRFNEAVTLKLLSGALEELKSRGLAKKQLRVVDVPGAVEIPIVAQELLKTGCHGVIALGAVIRGETSHYDYVCNSVERGCSELALKFSKPVVFGVLTTENEDQAFARVGGTHGHKGKEAAQVIIEMLNKLEQIKKKEI